MAKLVSELPQDVPVREMKDGDVAVITEHPLEDERDYYSGRIIQNVNGQIISVGMPYEYSFRGSLCEFSETFRVRILPKGTLIEL